MGPRNRHRYELRMFFLKIGLLLSVFCVFFLMLSFHNPWIIRPSRTAAITMMTFAIMLPFLISVYHSFEIGRRSVIDTITTTSFSVALVDVIVYMQLLIMNFNDNNRSAVMPLAGEVGCLALGMLFQFGLIILFTRLSTDLYRKNNPPRRTCLICKSESDARMLRDKLSTAKNRFRIEHTLYYGHDNLREEIPKYEQIFIYNLPLSERHSLVEYCYQLSKPVSYNMEITDIIGYGAGHDMFKDVSFISADNRRGLSAEQRIIKRTLDIVVSALMLLLLSPIMLVCAAAIWLYDRESVFFCQPRATRGGRIFTIYKFRTMRTNADAHRSVQSDDDRITPVGRILRRFRLDELPQLINILKGDMSLVGPRPEILKNVEDYTAEVPEFSYRLAVKAGLTGYAQIAGKYNTAPKEKMMMDLMYIEDYSIWRDIKIMLQTITVFFHRESTEAFDDPKTKGEEDMLSGVIGAETLSPNDRNQKDEAV